MFDKKSVCVITGASQGLGRCIAELFSEKLAVGSVFILMSRNVELLEQVSKSVSSRQSSRCISTFYDQGSLDQTAFDNVLKDSFQKVCPEKNAAQFEQAILINNAGSLEHLDYARNMDNVALISSYLNINVTGCLAITSKFLQVFNPSFVERRMIINISSLAALSPFKSWCLYSMAKAARDMLMKTIGSEEDKIRTLNYAPGPLRTEMSEVASKFTKDPELRNWFVEQLNGGTLIECETTVKKLMEILSKDSFENGAHIDFYDDIN